MANMDIGDTELAARLGISRQAVHNRRKGRRQMSLSDIEATAKALDVEARIFLGTPAEPVSWLLEHKSHLIV